MKIKSREDTRRPVDISEWNDEVKAYVKSLDILESIIFNDQFFQYHDKTLSAEERAEAGISICVMSLVGEDGQPLLSLGQMEELKKASFEPITRIITIQFEAIRSRGELEKNS